jgi:hypothetical protein
MDTVQKPGRKRRRQWSASEMGKKGGKARFKKLTKEERSELGRMAALAKALRKKNLIT